MTQRALVVLCMEVDNARTLQEFLKVHLPEAVSRFGTTPSIHNVEAQAIAAWDTTMTMSGGVVRPGEPTFLQVHEQAAWNGAGLLTKPGFDVSLKLDHLGRHMQAVWQTPETDEKPAEAS